MRKLALVMAIAGIVGGLLASVELPDRERIESAGVSASFPGEPVRQGRSAGTFLGYMEDGMQLSLAAMQLAAGPPPAVSDLCPHSLTRKGARVREQLDIQVDGIPGREFVLAMRGRTARQQMFVRHGHLITAVAIYREAEPPNPLAEDAERFLRSLNFD